MKLIIHGDSWAQGSELIDPDLKYKYPNLKPEQIEKNLFLFNENYQLRKSFGGILSNHIGLNTYTNLAHAGCSNDSIVRETVRHISHEMKNFQQKGSDLFVLIQWTWASRVDFFFDEPVFWLPDHNLETDGTSYWQTLCLYDSVNKSSYNKMRNCYYQHCFHSQENISRFLHQVLFLQSFLKVNKIPFLFFSGNNDPLWKIKLGLKNEYEPYLSDIMNLIDPISYMNFKENFNSFFTKITKRPCNEIDAFKNLDPLYFNSEQHPNENGHKFIGDNLWKYIIENQILKK